MRVYSVESLSVPLRDFSSTEQSENGPGTLIPFAPEQSSYIHIRGEHANTKGSVLLFNLTKNARAHLAEKMKNVREKEKYPTRVVRPSVPSSVCPYFFRHRAKL